MSNQKAVHIFKDEVSWNQINNGKMFKLGITNFLCGKKWEWIRDPKDKPLIPKVKKSKLTICKKCEKIRRTEDLSND